MNGRYHNRPSIFLLWPPDPVNCSDSVGKTRCHFHHLNIHNYCTYSETGCRLLRECTVLYINMTTTLMTRDGLFCHWVRLLIYTELRLLIYTNVCFFGSGVWRLKTVSNSSLWCWQQTSKEEGCFFFMFPLLRYTEHKIYAQSPVVYQFLLLYTAMQRPQNVILTVHPVTMPRGKRGKKADAARTTRQI